MVTGRVEVGRVAWGGGADRTDDAGPSEVADRNVIHGAPCWHEVQADRGIAAWLIPRPFFGGVARRTMHGQHTASKSVLRSPSKPLNP